ncbi:hypothetical protein ED733_007314 [Metarhizium rileyi]|uniref:Uncharacterized protein n=1 Tax=Metarhizium rileyi (strain RCEF 4871) TaxID=1649241 RepID=A0A5C6GD38_METRR|nr:hypothetical protein ED733_007314 [Metarhizium rileyi]
MGIKGIYKELGPGRRISLSKLAADSLESTNLPYRVAIDFAIWHFQTQAAQGGTNPALRTLFYRLVRLLGTPIRPIFVFDGPNKPVFKRNKRAGRGDGAATAMAKHLIRLFGFPIHDAPGEGEAECALLQQNGVVDAVLSEDVDTIMFGCTKTLRNWSSEGKTSTAPTHVSLYDVDSMALGDLGLDREGMVLVALMSGGDYLPDGIPGCGVKVACEAAKAGFGTSVCRLKVSDKDGIRAWRSSLVHELQTNEKGHFRTKHKALTIPEDFPNLEVLRYYTHPVVSPTSSIESIRQKMEQKQMFQLIALREFTRENFGWDYRIGAIKFIRVLGQAMLVQNMAGFKASGAHHVKRISGRRTHFSTDGTPELRLTYIPEEVVPIDLSTEVDEAVNSGRMGLALNSDEEFDAPEDEPSTNAPKVFDVTKPDLAWVLEGLVKQSAPDVFLEWQVKEDAKSIQRSPTKPKKKSGVAKTSKGSDMPRGSLDKYVTVTKAALATKEGLPNLSDRRSPPRKNLSRPSGKPSTTPQRQSRESESGRQMLKQSSLKMFLGKSEVRPTEERVMRTEKRTEEEMQYDSDFESASSPIQPTSSVENVSVDKPASSSEGRRPPGENTELLPKKKLFRARLSGSGFVEEVELDEEERIAELDTQGGRRRAAVRWSDVSIIDLTEANK